MIETGYFAKIDDYPETDVLVCVSRKFPWFIKRLRMIWLSELSPSEELLGDWKYDRLSWEEYVIQYKIEMDRQLPQRAIRSLRRDNITYRLMCWEKEPPCHRFILEKMIGESA